MGVGGRIGQGMKKSFEMKMFDILIMMMVSQCIRGSKFFKLWNLNMCGLLQNNNISILVDKL